MSKVILNAKSGLRTHPSHSLTLNFLVILIASVTIGTTVGCKKSDSGGASEPAPAAAPAAPAPTPTPVDPTDAGYFSYELQEFNGTTTCKTDRHEFNSRRAYCEGLKNEDLNKSCAKEQRSHLVYNNCPKKTADGLEVPAYFDVDDLSFNAVVSKRTLFWTANDQPEANAAIACAGSVQEAQNMGFNGLILIKGSRMVVTQEGFNPWRERRNSKTPGLVNCLLPAGVAPEIPDSVPRKRLTTGTSSYEVTKFSSLFYRKSKIVELEVRCSSDPVKASHNGENQIGLLPGSKLVMPNIPGYRFEPGVRSSNQIWTVITCE
jgi:hypothetical protein